MRNALKKQVLAFLVSLFTICMLLVMSFGDFTFTAKASTGYKTTEVTMQNGASAYVGSSGNLSGIKFHASVSGEINPDATYGIMIVPLDYFAKAGLSTTDDKDFINEFKQAKLDGDIAYEPIAYELVPDSDKNFSLSLDGILSTNYDRQFVGIAFVKTDAGYKYTEVSDGNIRDIVYIASKGLAGQDVQPDEATVMENIVTQGVANVTDSLNYSLSGDNAGYVGEEIALTLTITDGLRLYSTWSSNNTEVATVDENGKVTLLSEGTATIKASVGELYSDEITITVSEKPLEPNVITGLTSANSISNYGYTGSRIETEFVSASDLTTTHGLTGDYSGNAYHIYSTQASGETTDGSWLFDVQPQISPEQFDAKVAEGYTEISFYIAAYSVGQTNVIKYRGDNSIYSKLNNAGTGQLSTTLTDKAWQKITIALDATPCGNLETSTVKDALFAKGHLIGFYVSTGASRSGVEHMFISELFFEEASKVVPIADNVIFSTATNKDDACLNNFASANYTSINYVTSEELAEAGITGEFTGNAIQVIRTVAYDESKSQTGMAMQAKIMPRYSREQFDTLVSTNGYTKLVIWVAGYTSDGASTFIQKDTNSLYSASATTIESKVWTKITLTLEGNSNIASTTVVDALFKEITSASDANPLFRLNTSTPISSTVTQRTSYLFIGDMFLE